MFRGVILGALAFVAVFFAQRRFADVGKDVARYNRIRAMSGDPPMQQQALAVLGSLLKAYGAPKPGDAVGLARSLQYDAIRYARISTM